MEKWGRALGKEHKVFAINKIEVSYTCGINIHAVPYGRISFFLKA